VQGRADAERIGRTGVPVVQINTGHAATSTRGSSARSCTPPLDRLDVLLIENVGNLVCPAEFDLGEHDKAMILSVTEGADKPTSTRHVPRRAGARALQDRPPPHVDFDLSRATRAARALNLDLEVFPSRPDRPTAWRLAALARGRIARVKG